ncbi:hypothetical protein EUX98_g6727, partial [Antrodiella citrinella]
GVEGTKVLLDKTIGVFRDRSIVWLVNGYDAVNDPEFVVQGWGMCKAGSSGYNLSYASLISFEARQELNHLATTDPEFFKEITQNADGEELPDTELHLPEDDFDEDDAEDVDSATKIKDVINDILDPSRPTTHRFNVGNQLDSDDEDGIEGFGAGDSDSDADYEPAAIVAEEFVVAVDDHSVAEGLLGRGKRVRKASRRYLSADWCRYDDNDE